MQGLTAIQGQEVTPNFKGVNNQDAKITTEAFSNPVFLNDEMHSNFAVIYEVDTGFLVELQGYYDTYLLGDVFRVPLITKYYVNDKLYFFSGFEFEADLDKYGRKPAPPRLKFKNGVGYDIDKNFSLEANHDLQFNKTNLGNYAAPKLFSFSGKYKF